MAKSLKDSMKELEEMNNAKIMSDDITAYSLEAASFSSPVVDNETTVSTYTNTTLPYSEKYLIYNEYVDEKISTIDENKNIELDESQVNLTQEENSQYVRFKMFRRYDGVDQLNMTLSKVAVSGSYNDLSNKPAIPTVGNGTVTIKQAGTSKGTFSMNQSGNTTIELTDNNSWRGVQNNLTSTATDQSLSAYQGKVLKDLVDKKTTFTYSSTQPTSPASNAVWIG